MNITFRYSHILFRINSENKRYIAYSQRYGETNKKRKRGAISPLLLYSFAIRTGQGRKTEKKVAIKYEGGTGYEGARTDCKTYGGGGGNGARHTTLLLFQHYTTSSAYV